MKVINTHPGASAGMKLTNLYRNHRAWWSSFTSCFVGTLLGIILTFGTTAYMERQNRDAIAYKTVVITLGNIDRYVTHMEEQVTAFKQQDSIFQAVLQHYPNQLNQVSKDTASLFFNCLSRFNFFALDTSTETIFSHNIDIWKTLDNMPAVASIGDCFAMKNQFVEIQKEIMQRRRKYFTDFYNQKDITSYHSAENALRAFLSINSARYFLAEHNGITQVLESCVKELKRANEWNKVCLNVTNEDLQLQSPHYEQEEEIDVECTIK